MTYTLHLSPIVYRARPAQAERNIMLHCLFIRIPINRSLLGLAAAIHLAMMNTSCAVTIPLDANMRIDVDGWNAYSQHGHSLNRTDMVDKLEKEPENSDQIQSARAMSSGGIALSILGGVGVGWAFGEYIAGKPEPHWWLAGVGGALVLFGGLPLALGSDYRVAQAVEEHNELIGGQQAREKRNPHEQTTPTVNTKSSSPLPEGFGFVFEQGPEDAGTLCRSSGYQWNEKGETFLCSGVPTAEIENASAELAFADGRISSFRILIHPQDNAGSWAGAISNVESVLIRMYGKPTERDFSVPSNCTGKAFMGCVTNGNVKGRSSWSKTPQRLVSMAIVNSPPPILVVEIKRVGTTITP